MNNPANEIARKARKQKKSYWETIGKGFIINVEHSELDKLEAYRKKCEERRKGR